MVRSSRQIGSILPLRILAALFLWIALFGCSDSPFRGRAPSEDSGEASRSHAPIAVLLSLDGVSAGYLEKTETPALARLAAVGVRATRLVPPFPANTFPSHATIATGVYSDRHGIINNQFDDAERGTFSREQEVDWYESEPLWITAERAGVRSAVLHWVCSVGTWDGLAPSYLEPFNPSTSDADRLAAILSWLRLPETERPRLIMAWLSGCDHVGHKLGPYRPEVLARLRFVDALIGQFVDEIGRLGLRDRVSLFIVSDHGMRSVDKEINLRHLVPPEARPWTIMTSGAVANLYFDSPEKEARALAEISGRQEFDVYRREDLPEQLHYRHPMRTGQVVAIAKPGFWFRNSTRPALLRPSSIPGQHGYPPQTPGMAGIFFATGPSIRKGLRLEEARAVDIYPTLLAVLGIPPTGNSLDGETLPIFRGDTPPGLH